MRVTLTPMETGRAEPRGLATQGSGWSSTWGDRSSTQVSRSTTVLQESDRGADAPQVDLLGGSSDPALAAPACGPSTLTRMPVERGVSSWLDHLSRADLDHGSLHRMIAEGVRGVGAAQSELADTLEVCAAHDEQLRWLLATGCTAPEAYWDITVADTKAACALMRPVYEMSQGTDGFVSLQVAPAHTRRTRATTATICGLHRRIDRPNLLVAIPATASGVQALQATVSAGCNINATSIFSLARYAAVIEAYQTGLEAFVALCGDPTTVHGLASFSLSRLDAEVDRRVELLGGRGAPELRGLAATAQAILACQLFEEQFSTQRWARLARRGATPQRLAWVCAGTDPDNDHAQQYLDAVSVRNTVQVLSASTVATVNDRSLGDPPPRISATDAAGVVSALAELRIDLDDVAAALERQSSSLAQHSLADALDQVCEGSGQP